MMFKFDDDTHGVVLAWWSLLDAKGRARAEAEADLIELRRAQDIADYCIGWPPQPLPQGGIYREPTLLDDLRDW